jgi:hypothetical protein
LNVIFERAHSVQNEWFFDSHFDFIRHLKFRGLEVPAVLRELLPLFFCESALWQRSALVAHVILRIALHILRGFVFGLVVFSFRAQFMNVDEFSNFIHSASKVPILSRFPFMIYHSIIW